MNLSQLLVVTRLSKSFSSFLAHCLKSIPTVRCSSEGHVHKALVTANTAKALTRRAPLLQEMGFNERRGAGKCLAPPPAQRLQVKPSSTQRREQRREARRAKQKQYRRSWGPGLRQVRAVRSQAGQGSLKEGGRGGWAPSILGSSSLEVGRKGSASRKQRLSWSNAYRKKYSL